jgi:hypothetical protein
VTQTSLVPDVVPPPLISMLHRAAESRIEPIGWGSDNSPTTNPLPARATRSYRFGLVNAAEIAWLMASERPGRGLGARGLPQAPRMAHPRAG